MPAGLALTLTRIEDGLFDMWDALPELFVMTNADGRLLRVSAACERLLGWTRTEVEGQLWSSFVHPDDLAAARTASARFRRNGEFVEVETRWLCKGGGARRFRWRVASALGPTGRAYAVGVPV